ncbi:hypothetical protein ACFL02_09485 [Planctomycetota bacterium]
MAEFSYDALGRRIQKYDVKADKKTRYYHNSNWQVLTETDENDNTLRWFVYGSDVVTFSSKSNLNHQTLVFSRKFSCIVIANVFPHKDLYLISVICEICGFTLSLVAAQGRAVSIRI